jgi:hypothetical protein
VLFKKQTVKRPIITVLLRGRRGSTLPRKKHPSSYGIPKTTINRAAMYNNGKTNKIRVYILLQKLKPPTMGPLSLNGKITIKKSKQWQNYQTSQFSLQGKMRQSLNTVKNTKFRDQYLKLQLTKE